MWKIANILILYLLVSTAIDLSVEWNEKHYQALAAELQW